MFSTFSNAEFLERYWQQSPVVLKQEFVDVAGVVNGNEIAGLACEEAVESRIIQGSGLDGPWTCRQGPFVDFDYNSLGASNWTLLVQGLDQWDDNVRSLLDRFSFLPAWRLEDVMASFAPVGGGAGPHFDYYDVFLVQVAGKRRWELGQVCDDCTALQENESVKLLKKFDTTSVYDLDAGDAIYIPAGLAHWGTSLSDDCVTLSVGFRAPSDKELLTEAVELLMPKLGEAARYKDSRGSIDKDRFKINAPAAAYAKGVISRLNEEDVANALTEALGRLVTDTRYRSFSEDTTVWTGNSLKKHLEGSEALAIVRQTHCRMAYSQAHLFVNGVAYAAAESFSKSLCHGELSDSSSTAEWEIVAALFNDDMIALA